VLLAIIFVFTCLPWIHQKVLANNTIENSTVQQNSFSFNELSHQVLAMVANMTGHSGDKEKRYMPHSSFALFSFKYKGHWPIGNQLLERILLASWCLSSSVLVYAYSSLLISFLTIPTLKPVAKSFDDIIFRNVQGLQPITGKNTRTTNMIAVAVFIHIFLSKYMNCVL